MSDDGIEAPDPDPIAVVDAWRERDAARVDPVRFAVIEGLARRAAAQQGDVRRRLTLRVEQLLAQRAAANTSGQAAAAADEAGARLAVLAQLSELVDRLGRTPAAPMATPSPPHRSATRRNDAAPTAPRSRAAPAAPAPPARNAVTAFKGTWSRLRAEQRLRQALAQVPAMAGPLNSSHVINRTLQAMRDLSPAYLDAFMQHVDTLLWLEQASGGDLTPRPAAAPAPAENGRASGSRTSRKTGAP